MIYSLFFEFRSCFYHIDTPNNARNKARRIKRDWNSTNHKYSYYFQRCSFSAYEALLLRQIVRYLIIRYPIFDNWIIRDYVEWYRFFEDNTFFSFRQERVPFRLLNVFLIESFFVIVLLFFFFYNYLEWAISLLNDIKNPLRYFISELYFLLYS